MNTRPHIIQLVADEVRREYLGRRTGIEPAPRPRILGDEIGVEFAGDEFIPYADLGYSYDVGFFRLSTTAGVINDAAPFAASGQLLDCGNVVVSTAVAQQLTADEIRDLLRRHACGDFGRHGEFYFIDVTDDMLDGEALADQPGASNKVNTLTGLNAVVSEYTVRETRIWVITEAGDSRTTLVLCAGVAPD